MREIGSEFPYQVNNINKCINLPKGVKDYAFVFSGRTAIESVLENETHIKKVMLPSYCCDSMIEPFRKKGVKICFYNVSYINGFNIDITIPRDVDALLWCNYFGYKLKMPNFTDFVSRGGIIIEDITHSFYSVHKYDKQSKYLIASIRKWEPILCGGYCASTMSKLKYIPEKLPDENLLTIDEESVKILKHIDSKKNYDQRRKNAMVLHKNLKNSSSINLLFDERDMDCPLFVPIIVNPNERNNIRTFLSNNNIYCPVHWPHPNEECVSNLYDMEISLICDQRYNENDMLRIVDTINKFQKISS